MVNNLSTLFLLPLLGLDRNVIRDQAIGKRRILNAYVKDECLNVYNENCLFVVHYNTQDRRFSAWEEQLIAQPHCIDSYDILDTNFGIKVFKMNEYEDYFNFMSGKYSEYTEWGKNRVTEFGVDDGLAVKQIIEKSPTLIKILAEKFNIEDKDIDSVFKECAPIWYGASVSNVINELVYGELKALLSSKKRTDLILRNNGD